MKKIKQCPICGKSFIPIKQNTKYCSKECYEKIKYTRTYYNTGTFCDDRSFIDDYIGNEIFINEEDLSKRPTMKDIVELERILDDFNIKVKIPFFKNLGSLISWKRKQLYEKLID